MIFLNILSGSRTNVGKLRPALAPNSVALVELSTENWKLPETDRDSHSPPLNVVIGQSRRDTYQAGGIGGCLQVDLVSVGLRGYQTYHAVHHIGVGLVELDTYIVVDTHVGKPLVCVVDNELTVYVSGLYAVHLVEDGRTHFPLGVIKYREILILQGIQYLRNLLGHRGAVLDVVGYRPYEDISEVEPSVRPGILG